MYAFWTVLLRKLLQMLPSKGNVICSSVSHAETGYHQVVSCCMVGAFTCMLLLTWRRENCHQEMVKVALLHVCVKQQAGHVFPHTFVFCCMLFSCLTYFANLINLCYSCFNIASPYLSSVHLNHIAGLLSEVAPGTQTGRRAY